MKEEEKAVKNSSKIYIHNIFNSDLEFLVTNSEPRYKKMKIKTNTALVPAF